MREFPPVYRGGKRELMRQGVGSAASAGELLKAALKEVDVALAGRPPPIYIDIL